MINKIIDYNYFLPEKNLALSPAVPRDSSKLFVYNTKTDEITFDYFYNLEKYLPENSFLVLNNTKVLPARVVMKKKNGGKIILLFLINEFTDSRVVRTIVDRKVNLGDLLFFDNKNYLEVIGQDENIFDLKFDFGREHLFDLLKKYGTMPIPPYLKKSPLSKNDLLKKYQTIFARAPVGARLGQAPNGAWLASVAAPTASLHFSERVFDKLGKKGIEKYFITLHVGLGTFAPITDVNLKQKKLHEEYFEINLNMFQSINRLKQEGKRLVAVGTTVVRTLESETIRINQTIRRSVVGSLTSLFIFPPYNFKMVDILITNFHLPKSSLMMLVEAFLQFKGAKKSLIELYNIAIKNNFRFYSFGDAMMIL